jgi:hypothetical protein
MDPISTHSEVFRFVNLRPVQQIYQDKIPGRFVTFNFFNSISPATLAGIEASENLLFTDLKAIIVGGGAADPEDLRTDLENAVTAFRSTSPNYIVDLEALDAFFPNLKEVLDYLILKDFKDTPALFRASIESDLIPSTIEAFIADADYLEKKLRLWDNLFAEVIVPKNVQIRENLTSYIRILELLENISDSLSEVSTSEGFRKKALGWVILPKPVFPLPVVENAIEENTEEPDNSAEVAKEEALERIKNTLAAYNEVIQALDAQKRSVELETKPIVNGIRNSLDFGGPKCQDVPEIVISAPQDVAYLSEANYDNLSAPTKLVIENLGIPVGDITADGMHDSIGVSIGRDYEDVFYDVYDSDAIVDIGHGTVVVSSQHCLGNDLPVNPCAPFVGGAIPKNSGYLKPVGIGDLLIVKHRLKKYEVGEVAHIENIMKSESKGRENRKLNRIEETNFQETEKYSETDSETRTTERLSMEREAANIMEQMNQNQSTQDTGFGISLTGGYGPVAVTASYSNTNQQSALSQTAMTDSVKTATAYSKELNERIRKRVIEKVRVQRTRTTIDEVIDINTHAFNNIEGTDHVRGIFHFVDKIYHSQLYNYGRRMMFEFMVPEPAAFHIFSQIKQAGDEKKIVKPKTLTELGITSINSINRWNYAQFGAAMGVSDLPVPPSQYTWVNKAYAKDSVVGSDPWALTSFADNSLEVPEGYEAEYFKIFYRNTDINQGGWLQSFVADVWSASFLNWNINYPLLNITGKIPVMFVIAPNCTYAVNIMVRCSLSSDAFERWKSKVHGMLLDAYNRQLADYKNQISALEIQQGINIQGDNPERNRAIEREELKKSIIEMYTAQKYEAFSAMQDNQPSQGYPQFNHVKAAAEGSFVKFFEHGFEWNNMTYQFYPYFWGRKSNWIRTRGIKDTDPIFEKFLQSGYARVVVPVRPRMNDAMLYYYHTGQIWMGGPPPGINDLAYLSLADEIAEYEGKMDEDAVPVKDACWEYKVPTSLVMLRQDPQELPDFSGDALCEDPTP